MTSSSPDCGFAPLHVHTDASVLDGLGHVQDYVDRAVELGLGSMCATDHGSLANARALNTSCRRAGIKPIIGMEAYISIGSRFEHNSLRAVDLGGEGEKTKDYEHLTLIAATPTGWRNLVTIHNLGWQTAWKGKSRADYELLAQHHEGLICLTGCLGGPVLGPAARGRMDQAEANLDRLITIFGAERTFVELMEHSIAEESAILPGVAALADRKGIRCVATCDSHYVRSDQALAHDAWLAKQRGTTVADPSRWRFHGCGYHLLGEGEMRALRPEPWWSRAVSNTMLVEQMVQPDVLGPTSMRLPTPPVPDSYDGDLVAWVVDWARHGAAERYGTPMPEQVRDRLNTEMRVFKRLGMVGYAALVGEMISWARTRGILVGPGRGSSAGSCLLYCLGITDIDPLESGTLFERFLDPERAGMPDVDTDFERGRRDEVYQHLVEIYGVDRVARLGTTGRAGAKAALKDAARQLGVSASWVGRLTKTIPGVGAQIPSISSLLADPVGERFRQILASCPTAPDHLTDLARGFEGTATSVGIHACGVIVSSEPLTDLIPIRIDAATGERIACWDGPECEQTGLVKLDLLGLRTLDQVRTACRIAGIDTSDIPRGRDVSPQDPVWGLLAAGDTGSVFQLESGGIRDLARRLAPRSEGDITALGALYRPGPMGTDMHTDYAERRNGRQEVSYRAFTDDADEAIGLDAILGPTHGLVVYQETMMRLGTTVGGFTASGTNRLRKAVSKKQQDVIDALGEEFVSGAVLSRNADGLPKQAFRTETAQHLWSAIEAAGRYAFNLSHAVAYGRITFWTAWLKAHHPAALGAATLAVTDTESRRAEAIGWMRERGIEVAAPDIQRGQIATTALDDRTVVLGLSEIKGVGSIARILVEHRPADGWPSIAVMVKACKDAGQPLTSLALESLAKAGALDSFGPRAGLVLALRALARGAEVTVPEVEYMPATRAVVQRQVLDTVSDDPLADPDALAALHVWRDSAGRNARRLHVVEAMRAGERVTVAAQVVACEDKAGETWRLRVLTLGDGPRRVEAAFWNERKDEIDHILAGQVVVVAGTVRTRSVPDADGGPDTVVRSLSATSLWIPDIPTGTTRPFAHSGIDEALERLCELSVPAAHQ